MQSPEDQSNRREFLATAAAGVVTLAAANAAAQTSAPAIRPFKVNVPQAAIVDLKQRLRNTHWTEAETVSDSAQGVQLARMKSLLKTWETDYDWRKVEARLNALP